MEEPAKHPDEDTAVALAAIEDCYAEEADRLAAEADSLQRQLTAARDRLAHVRDGGRIADREAVIVHSWALARATAIGNTLIDHAGTATKTDWSAAHERADAVGRGLRALGYEVPDHTGPH